MCDTASATSDAASCAQPTRVSRCSIPNKLARSTDGTKGRLCRDYDAVVAFAEKWVNSTDKGIVSIKGQDMELSDENQENKIRLVKY